MRTGRLLIQAAAGAIAVAPLPAFAQAAAESAVLTGTTGSATAKGSRSVGSATGGAMGRVGETIRTRGSGRRSSARRPRRGDNGSGAVIGTGDVLEGTDAETHAMENGATVRVTGGLRPRAKRGDFAEESTD